MLKSNFFPLPPLSELGDAREIEVSDSHGRHENLARLRGYGFRGGGKGINLIKGAQRALMKAEIPHGGHDFTVFDEKSSVPCHAGEGQIRRIHRADVPEIRDENSMLGRADQV